jgi:hypothetical protein
MIPQWLLQIRTFSCSNLNTKTFKHTFQVHNFTLHSSYT